MPDHDLSHRIHRLERRNRLLTCGVLALAALCTLPAFASLQDSHVQARSFTLLDAAEHAIGKWSADAKGLPKFELFDSDQKPRVTAMVTTDDTVVSLRDRAGLVRCGLAVDNAGRPHILLSDKAGRPRLHLSVNEMDSGNLIVLGPEGTVAAGLGIGDDGKPWFRPLANAPAEPPKRAQPAEQKEPPPDAKKDLPSAESDRAP